MRATFTSTGTSAEIDPQAAVPLALMSATSQEGFSGVSSQIKSPDFNSDASLMDELGGFWSYVRDLRLLQNPVFYTVDKQVTQFRKGPYRKLWSKVAQRPMA